DLRIEAVDVAAVFDDLVTVPLAQKPTKAITNRPTDGHLLAHQFVKTFFGNETLAVVRSVVEHKSHPLGHVASARVDRSRGRGGCDLALRQTASDFSRRVEVVAERVVACLL